MKNVTLVWFLLSLASAASACDLLGVKGNIAENGQSITDRQLIPLKEQATRYGGYEKAADFIEQNRRDVVSNEKYSPEVRRQVDSDLRSNAEQLKCWASVCKNNATNTACQF